MERFKIVLKIVAFIACGIMLEWDPINRIIEGKGRLTTYVSILCGLYFLVYMPIRIYRKYRRNK